MTPAPLTGLAIADALGMPFETQPHDSPALLAWDGSYGSSEYHKLGPGQWTDDTQMSLALANSLLENRAYLPINVADSYLKWFKSGDCRGIGTNTKRAMQNLEMGVSFLASGIPLAEGNGTAMRAAPIGVAFRKSTEHVVFLSGFDSAITHASAEAMNGSTAVALAVAHLVLGGARISLIPTLLPYLTTSRVKAKLEALASPRPNITAHVADTLEAAFYAFMSTRSFTEAVETAIRYGGDTDSVGAITGALAGAYYGYENIPKSYIEKLELSNEIHDIELRLLNWD